MKIAEIKLHPEGEKDFEFQFAPSGGTHKIVATDDELSAYGGIVAWDHFLERTGIVDTLHLHYPKLRTSPNATPVKDILKGIMLNFLLGGTRFAHQRRLQDDRAVANILGLTRGKINGEDAFRRLCQGLDKEQMRQWMRTAEQTLYHATPSQWIADWDSTVITKYAEQEDTAIGYNPQKPGRKSLHPLVCVVAGTRLALHMRWRRGNTVSATQWIEAMEEVYSHPEAQARLKLNRGDIGFGQEKIMAWHEGREKKRPKYLFKLKQTANVKRAIAKIKWPEKLYDNEYGIEQYAESRVKISGWSCERRIVVTRTLRPRKASPQDELWDLAEEEYCVYVTNLELEEADAAQVVICYRKRADSENVFDELKNQWGFEGFSSGKAVVAECASRLMLIVYNLWSIFVRVITNRENHTEAVTSRYELLLLPARLVKSGRARIVKLAIGEKLQTLLKAAYQRLNDWLGATAPQLRLHGELPPDWNLFLPKPAQNTEPQET